MTFSYSERMQRRSMIFALLGLLFASLAAGLIVASARSVVRTTVVAETITLPVEMELPNAVTMIRGSRRLMDGASEVSLFAS